MSNVDNINIDSRRNMVWDFSSSILTIIFGKNPIKGGMAPKVSMIISMLIEVFLLLVVCFLSFRYGMLNITIIL